MVLVDTSAWIDYFRDQRTATAESVATALRTTEVAVGDLILAELLQGVRDDRDVAKMLGDLSSMRRVELCGQEIAELSAANYRMLRRKGITIRGTIDVIVATWCVANDAQIIHNDRDMTAMERELGLVRYVA